MRGHRSATIGSPFNARVHLGLIPTPAKHNHRPGPALHLFLVPRLFIIQKKPPPPSHSSSFALASTPIRTPNWSFFIELLHVWPCAWLQPRRFSGSPQGSYTIHSLLMTRAHNTTNSKATTTDETLQRLMATPDAERTPVFSLPQTYTLLLMTRAHRDVRMPQRRLRRDVRVSLRRLRRDGPMDP